MTGWCFQSEVTEDIAASTLLSLGSLALRKLAACCEDIRAALGRASGKELRPANNWYQFAGHVSEILGKQIL